jgi:hypothetical protein
MTDLSPATQAVRAAVHHYETNHWLHVNQVAAVSLRAAADYLKQQKGWSLGVRWSADELIGIANELEGPQ